MSEIVSLLRTLSSPAPTPAPPASAFTTKSTPVASPCVLVITHDHTPSIPFIPISYRDTARLKAPPQAPNVTPTDSTPIRGLRLNGSTSLPQDFEQDAKSPVVQRQRR
jgi:hypothetical protein